MRQQAGERESRVPLRDKRDKFVPTRSHISKNYTVADTKRWYRNRNETADSMHNVGNVSALHTSTDIRHPAANVSLVMFGHG